MAYTLQKRLPTSKDVLEKLPLSETLAVQVEQDRQEIKDILSGKDDRKLLIIGPCSAWPDTAVIEYARKLKPLADQVADKLKVVMRAYLQKPRTTTGWLGAMNQIDPYKEPDIEEGIYYSRKMMLEVLEIGLPLADEAVFTHNDGYIVDLLSWVAIGARATEDQEHRVFASMIPHPVGMKNPTSGNIQIALNSLIAGQHPHVCAMHGDQVKTAGNPYAHLILRGGNKKPNYHFEKLTKVSQKLDGVNIENKAIIIDASHENCLDEEGRKCCERQSGVILDVMDSCDKDPQIAKYIKGFMVESFLQPGAQNLNSFSSVDDLEYGKSVTDPCIGWEETEKLILDLRSKV